MHHVLVTGGAGFIGSHAVERLLELGHRVTVLDDFSTGRRENLASVAGHARLSVVEGDVAEPLDGQLAVILREVGPVSHVLHLAAQVSVALSVEEPLEDARRNLVGTLRVLELARSNKIDKIVFASSAAAYGDGPQPAHEGLECRPLSPYGLHKLAGEHHLRIHAELTGLGALSFRFFNVFGPRQSPRSHYAGVISIFIGRALAGEPLTIFGKGDATRDFVYVADLVAALVKGLFSGPRSGEVLNVGTGLPTSVAELAKAVVAVTGSASPIAELPPRAGDILHSRADATRIREALGWTAGTPLADGLRETAAWLGAGGGVF